MRFSLLLLILTGLSACSVLQPHDAPIKAPDIFTVAEADKVLADAARDRARAEAVFVQAEQVCYQKFFVNACLDDAREVRRTALAPVRAAEVAAARFKREASVAQRDRELAEAEAAHEARLKQAQLDEEANAARRAQEEAAAAAAAAAPAGAPAVKEKKPGMTVEQRAARRDQREKMAQAKQKERAARHADNVAAHEARRQESEERVRRVEEKKKAKAASKSTND